MVTINRFPFYFLLIGYIHDADCIICYQKSNNCNLFAFSLLFDNCIIVKNKSFVTKYYHRWCSFILLDILYIL